MHNNAKPRIAKLITNFKKIEIQQLFKSINKICRYQGLDIKIAPTNHIIGRLLIITPKKIGNAPERNLIKRRLKSIFYQEKIYEHPFNWVFFCKKETILINFDNLKEMILKCLHALPKYHLASHTERANES